MSHNVNCANYLVLPYFNDTSMYLELELELTKFSIRLYKKTNQFRKFSVVIHSCSVFLCVINAPYFLYFFLQICIKI